MVFPKPGMQYRYKYKLPDHMQRKQKVSSNRDHTKIYEMLSEDDLLDIRGLGLRKLDDEEAALFDKQKEENEMVMMKEAENKSKSDLPATATKKIERNSLICAIKNDEQPMAVMPKIEVEIGKNLKEEVKEDVKVKNVTPVKKEKKVAPVIIFHDENWMSSTRIRKRKPVESVGSTSPALAKKALSGTDDSSKENVAQKQKPKSSKRKKEKSKKQMANASGADPQQKTWRVRGSTGGKSPKKNQLKKKRKYTKAKDQSHHPALVNLMSNGKIKIRLSALHAYCATAHWFISNQLKNHRARSRLIPHSFFRQPPLPPPSSSSNLAGEVVQKKKRGPYKKRVGPPKQQAKKQGATGQPPKILTPKQALRRVRYRIEKHFAKMPGKQYRCPKMTDKSSIHIQVENEKGTEEKQVWICLVCHKEERDEKGDVMVSCDGPNCGDWYHLRCIGVPDEKYPQSMKWYCKRCMAREVHAGTFDEDKFPLYN